MHGIGLNQFWCPRCGTIKEKDGVGAPQFPLLVGRCRRFAETLGPSWAQMWKILGIAESINLPKDRPT